MKKDYFRKNFIIRLSVVTIFIIGFFIVVSSNIKVYTNITYDVSSTRFLKTMHLVSKEIFNNVFKALVTPSLKWINPTFSTSEKGNIFFNFLLDITSNIYNSIINNRCTKQKQVHWYL